jgi:DNA polymerase
MLNKSIMSALDETTRRYYLDAMGIQCWQLLDQKIEQPPILQVESLPDNQPDDYTDDRRQPEVSPPEKPEGEKPADIVNNSVAKPATVIQADIEQCEMCMLHKNRKQPITGRGNQAADLMFILLSPGAADDLSGTICSGEENELLTKMLAAINVSIDDVYITSLLKCCIPANHTISPAEILSCHRFLTQQIQTIKPKLLVILGETAIRCLLQKNLSLDNYRDMNNRGDFKFESMPLFVTYSPEELLQHPENKRKAWIDLQQLKSIIGNY